MGGQEVMRTLAYAEDHAGSTRGYWYKYLGFLAAEDTVIPLLKI